jgi:hypothetical protein
MFRRFICVSSVVICFLIGQRTCLAQAEVNAAGAHDALFGLPLAGSQASSPKILDRYGIPFLEAAQQPPAGSPTRVTVGSRVKRIFLLGMTESNYVHAWADPRDNSARYFVGDNLGQIRLDYADGSTQVFPLVLGESVWWGVTFYQCPDPFPTDAHLRDAFSQSMHLFPAAPVEDGKYVAVIVPKAVPLVSVEVEDSAEKKGSVVVSGITVESAEGNQIAGATALPAGHLTPEFEEFANKKPLRPSGVDEAGAQRRLNDLSLAFYSSDDEFRGPVPVAVPAGYSGPEVSFKGDMVADILTNAFYANVQDMLAKIDDDGTYHTSTKGSVLFGGPQFGTYRPNGGIYYADSWSRDLGRSLQELTELGFISQATRTADYSLREARLWAENPSLKYQGVSLPPHWSRVINKPNSALPFENDGHGLISLFLYKLWQRLPDRDEWLRAHWADVKAAGDWIPWQFDHPEISGAANGVLYTTGESAAGKGYSVYADYVCMDALQGLAQMADSIGETQSAAAWRDRAEKMRTAIAARYLTIDPKYGRVWTLDFAGWPNKSTVLGPVIFPADYRGFAPEDSNPDWCQQNEATYQRLVDSYRPFGFYGQAMGYGQGFVTQSALLLDRMQDATQMLHWTAKQVDDPKIGSFVVPEGVQIDPTGHFWYPAGDLGNGVQEAEIIKAFRIVVGVDDTQPNRVRVFPRMPYGWSEIAVNKYPVLSARDGKVTTAFLHYRLTRSSTGMDLTIGSDTALGPIAIRLGPFEKRPTASSIRINEHSPSGTTIEHSGDSWWVRFTTPIGPETH